MDTIPQYIERKHNPALINYPDPRMKEYLEFSHGVIVYQDDVLLTAVTLAGYSWLKADTLRKAMGKKIPEVMAAERDKLIKGFVEYGGLKPALAEKLWKLIEPFAAYGFNKAHAASYGKVAYQTAYMKANWPVEYMAAILTAEAGDIDTVGIMVTECKRMDILVLPPDVQSSFGDFTVILGDKDSLEERGADLSKKRAGAIEASEPPAKQVIDAERAPASGSIRFGLYSIKNFGRGVADEIIAERKAGGPFISLADFLRRIKTQNLNKKGLESLIECGALDSLGERGQMLANIELLLQYHREASTDMGHESLFGGAELSELKLPPAAEAPLATRLAWEKELLGLYVSGHPLDKFKEKLEKRPMTLGELKTKMGPGMTVVAAGIVEGVRTILTRGGDQMAFVKIADLSGTIEAAVFPRVYAENKELLKPENIIALKGRLSERNGELSMVADKLKAL